MRILKIVMGTYLYSSLSFYAMNNEPALKKHHKKPLYLTTADNKHRTLSIAKAQESTPLRMFIEQFGGNTKNKPLAVNYTNKEIKEFSHALDNPIDNEKTADIAARFKALHLYSRCIKQCLPGDIDHTIAQIYFPDDVLTSQIIKWGHTIQVLEKAKMLENFPISCIDIHFSAHNDYFIVTVPIYRDIRQIEYYKQCQLWHMKNNRLIKKFSGLDLKSQLSPYGTYLVVNTLPEYEEHNELIFYDINHNTTTTLQSDTRYPNKLMISPYGKFIITYPFVNIRPNTFTIWEVDKNNIPQKFPTNPHLSNISVNDILLNSNETHMFILRNNEILLFDLTIPQAAPIVIPCYPTEKYPLNILLFTDDESCITAQRNHGNGFRHLFNISNFSAITDISHIFQNKENKQDSLIYTKSCLKRLKENENKKGLIFLERSDNGSPNFYSLSDKNHEINGFALYDQKYNILVSWGSKDIKWQCKGEVSNSGNDLIVIGSKPSASLIHKPLVRYSLMRFALMSRQQEEIINRILAKLTTEQSTFLYSLCKTLKTKIKYYIHRRSSEDFILQSFNQKQRDLLTTILPITYR